MSRGDGFTHVPRIGAAAIFERIARDYLDGKRPDFPAELLPDLMRTYLEVLARLRALEADGSLAQETTTIVDLLIATRYANEARAGPVSEERIREIVTRARHDVADASGSPYETVRREHNARSGKPKPPKPRKQPPRRARGAPFPKFKLETFLQSAWNLHRQLCLKGGALGFSKRIKS